MDEDQELLNTLGFFGDGSDSDDGASEAKVSHTDTDQATVRPNPQARGAPWFEEIVRNTSLGRFKQQRGRHSDNGVQVEWEVTEWMQGEDENGSGAATPSKRKIGHVEAEDADMRS